MKYFGIAKCEAYNADTLILVNFLCHGKYHLKAVFAMAYWFCDFAMGKNEIKNLH
jgi:hypothetical protein